MLIPQNTDDLHQSGVDRSCYLDNACCLLIFHMIYTCHIASHCGNPVPDIIAKINIAFSFFMSWFFFKGGMMHKNQPSRILLQKSVKRLLVPYAIFILLGVVLQGFINIINNNQITATAFLKDEIVHFLYTAEIPTVAASWFLLSLFVVRLIFNSLISKVHAVFITCFFVLVAYLLFVMQKWGLTKEIQVMGVNFHILIPHYLGNICHGLALYSLGYYLKEKQFSNAVFITALVLFVLNLIIPAGIDFRANTPWSGSYYLLAVMYEIAGCIVINNIFKRFVDIKIPFVTHVGSNSMVYYLVHYPVMCLTISLFGNTLMDFGWWIRFLIVSSVVTIFLIFAEWLFRNKKLKFIVGAS
jgi:peptidoglycan/LPS O-acetylase OafA/YrhL